MRINRAPKALTSLLAAGLSLFLPLLEATNAWSATQGALVRAVEALGPRVAGLSYLTGQTIAGMRADEALWQLLEAPPGPGDLFEPILERVEALPIQPTVAQQKEILEALRVSTARLREQTDALIKQTHEGFEASRLEAVAHGLDQANHYALLLEPEQQKQAAVAYRAVRAALEKRRASKAAKAVNEGAKDWEQEEPQLPVFANPMLTGHPLTGRRDAVFAALHPLAPAPKPVERILPQLGRFGQALPVMPAPKASKPEEPVPEKTGGWLGRLAGSARDRIGGWAGGLGNWFGGGRGRGSGGGKTDDGGGPDYPHREISFHGEKFRSVLFRPNVAVESEIIRAIDKTQNDIYLSLYEFTQAAVLDALRQARARGVEIHIILDYNHVFPPPPKPGDEYTPRISNEIWGLARAEGFDVKVLKLGHYGINHNKFAVFDGELAVFGSYNWSRAAEASHYENANFSNDPVRVRALKEYWDWLDTFAAPIKYVSKGGRIELKNPNHAWPKTLPAPPMPAPETVSFNRLKLPPVVFSPDRTEGRSIEDRRVQEIEASETSIDISAFALRSTRIAQALVRAHSRGVPVRVLFDEGQARDKYFAPYVQWLAFYGIKVKTLAGPDPNSDFPPAQKNHHKFAIFDGKLVQTGSPNWTKTAAVANAENGHHLDDPTDVSAYAFHFEHMWGAAKPLAKPAKAPEIPTDAELLELIDREPEPEPTPAPEPQPSRPVAKLIRFNGKDFPTYAFRPDTPIEPLLVDAIDATQKNIHLSLYEFDLDSVLDALRRAKARGVKIELVIDRSHVYTTGTDKGRGEGGKDRPHMPKKDILALINEGFDIKLLNGKKGGIMHNKFALFDVEDGDGLLVYGSYNWSVTAEHNHFENVIFTKGKVKLSDYLGYFNYMRALGSDVDREKLDEVLNRTIEAAIAEQSLEETLASAGDGEEQEEEIEPEGAGVRKPKPPPPPHDPSTPIEFNGELFSETYFSPGGGVLGASLRATKATASGQPIRIMMFVLRARELADELVKAHRRNVPVRLLLDLGQAAAGKFDEMRIGQWFAERGLDVRLLRGPNRNADPRKEKQHNKFFIFDASLLLNGSANATDQANDNNFENENVIEDPDIIAGFVDYFERYFLLGEKPWTRSGGSESQELVPMTNI